MSAELLRLEELVERLDALEERRTPVGWSVEEASERASLERDLMDLLTRPPDDDERRRTFRLPCRLEVALRTRRLSLDAEITDIGPGGVFVETDAEIGVGAEVELEVRSTNSDEHGLRVRGEVTWALPGVKPGIGVSFRNRPSAAHERRLRRFILELLRHREAA